MKQNPVLVYKNQMDYTYDDLSDQFRVSRSVVQRAIEGAYSHLPPGIAKPLCYIQGISEAELDRQYQEFIADELSKVVIPPVAFEKHMDLDDFDIWCSVLLRINGVQFVGEVPKLSVARILKLNVAVIENFYSGRTAHMPDSIIDRVEQIKESK